MPIRNSYTPYDIERTKKAIGYIHRCYMENISADQLSIEASIDVRLLQSLMQFMTGMTVHHYLVKVRIEQATKDLEDRFELTIEQIARRHGFNSSSHFIKCFRERHGITPNEYRYHIINKGKAV